MGDSATIYWKNGDVLGRLLEDVPNTIEFDEFGITRATLNYTCFWHLAPSLVDVVKYHPDFPWLKRVNANIEREEANCGKVKIDFEGIPPNDNEDYVKKIYSLDGATSTEPIETHPNFKDFARDVDEHNTDNGARSVANGEDRGQFLGFSFLMGADADDEQRNPKAGIRSYLEPALVYTETRVYDAISAQNVGVQMNALGHIDNPPASSILPEVNEKRNWLLISCVVQEIGDGIKITRKWRLSGRNGWDPDLYSAD